ncbi:hypothetical protein PHLGIDRAFT_438197 [Phlebiopsis gigantea 11061_1 CR5-6]|uniref:Uncharacterized protein n=1 Tax=Phlebiopsis gigantea (strain 11061_1 CR5-6) TaxID=745531 RepID=A0A0C3P1L0_PHLG1|nr:hypothetical protein PHLGIDRAFT_438197 [Phlebiopsis gigantea 11061_1 CR5-6]
MIANCTRPSGAWDLFPPTSHGPFLNSCSVYVPWMAEMNKALTPRPSGPCGSRSHPRPELRQRCVDILPLRHHDHRPSRALPEYPLKALFTSAFPHNTSARVAACSSISLQSEASEHCVAIVLRSTFSVIQCTISNLNLTRPTGLALLLQILTITIPMQPTEIRKRT